LRLIVALSGLDSEPLLHTRVWKPYSSIKPHVNPTHSTTKENKSQAKNSLMIYFSHSFLSEIFCAQHTQPPGCDNFTVLSFTTQRQLQCQKSNNFEGSISSQNRLLTWHW